MILAISAALCASLASADIWEPGTALHEKIWYDWDADTLPVGKVREWKDSTSAQVAAVQADPARQPEKQPGGVHFPPGADCRLEAPWLRIPERAHRAAVMVFAAKVSSSPSDSGMLFAANGHQGNYNHRLPGIGYRRGDHEYTVHWTGQPDAAIRLPAGADESWHVIVTRRVDGRHYASIDGQPEVQAEIEDLVIPRDESRAKTLIGDTRPNGIEFIVNRIMLLHEELSAVDVDRIAGWAMWKTDSQSRLPPSHPYRKERPEPGAPKEGFVGHTEASWAKVKEQWGEKNATKEQTFGRPIAPLLEGYTTVFEDQFDSMTITDESSGEGPWYSPGHPAATGRARSVKPGREPNVYSQAGSELTITMQRVGKTWFSGSFTSVNVDGRGQTWNPAEHPTYFEARMKCSPGNDFASWPAFWIKAVDEYFTQTVPRTEIDIYEGYNSDPKGHHQAYHSWKAARQYGDRPNKTFHVGNYTGLHKNWPDAPVDLFDNEYHTYGALITPKHIIFSFDGKELMRAPTTPDMLRPMFILVDLALLPKEADKADGEYKLVIDYVRVRQKIETNAAVRTQRERRNQSD
ncbi:glycoside hydrolase family 16 protein [Posidoniimonas polymericola]|uniref:glycoside hydrolase family 16 protein n=1 Tax=Posidoniimonas polymericola TaxID=2528002 RepID=UPI001E2F6C1E|nr:glycoside hydrolase family 16 protein [Posidoniimonas polymericola]